MLKAFAAYITYDLMALQKGSRIADALNFFIYDTIKIFLLLSVIIFIVSVIRSYFPPEKTKRILSHKKEFIGNILAALLGIVTPFCSCSAVPLFIGFVEAGVPLGVTFSFLISSPMVNEVAVVLLWGLFGWKIAAIYMGTGLLVAVLAGFIIGKLKLEKWVEEYVYKIKTGQGQEIVAQAFRERLQYAKWNTADILKEGLVVCCSGYRYRRLYSRLCAAGLSRPLRRQRQSFCCADRCCSRCSALFQCSGRNTDRLRSYGERLEHRHSPCFYDGGDRVVSSRDDNPEEGAEDTPSCCVCGDHDSNYYCGRLFI